MTVITEDGRDWYQDRARGDAEPFDEVAVGTGDWPDPDDLEQADDLDDEAYRGEITDGNIEIDNVSDTGRLHVTIEISGGTEVPGDTEITEMAIFADDLLVWIVSFDAVPVEAGVTEEFTMPIEIRRG